MNGTVQAPAVAGIICNWNRKDDVLRCIESVRESDIDLDVFVVDNASTDGSLEAIRRRYPAQVVLQNEVNLGGAAGFDRGIQHVLALGHHDYVWLLDNDVVVAPDALRNLVDVMRHDNSLGVVGSKILLADEGQRVQEMGAFIDWATPGIVRNHVFECDGPSLGGTETVDYVPACSLLARVTAIRHVGSMDASYFLYYDDIDWAMRMRRLGYGVAATGTSRVWHRRGAAVKTTTLPTYYWCRNQGRFHATYTPAGQWAQSMGHWVRSTIGVIATCEVTGKPNTAATFRQALSDAADGRTGKATWYSPAASEEATPWSLTAFCDGPVALRNNGHASAVRQMLKVKYPKLQIVDHQDPMGGGVEMTPVAHVYDTPFQEVSGTGRWLVDEFSNLLPMSAEGRAVHRDRQRIAQHLSATLLDDALSRFRRLRAVADGVASPS